MGEPKRETLDRLFKVAHCEKRMTPHGDAEPINWRGLWEHTRELLFQLEAEIKTKDRWHELKCWPKWFSGFLNGVKTFDIRRYDRDFRVGDYILLRCWDPTLETRVRYTGGQLWVRITYKLHPSEYPGIADGFVVLGLERVQGMGPAVSDAEHVQPNGVK